MVNILVLDKENEQQHRENVKARADAIRSQREGKLQALALQEKQRRQHQDPFKTARGPAPRETPRAPNKVAPTKPPAAPALSLAALRLPIDDVMNGHTQLFKGPKREDVSMLLASTGSRPPTASSRPPTASVRLDTAVSRPSTAQRVFPEGNEPRPPTAGSRPPTAGTAARPGTAASSLSQLQRQLEEQLTVDGSGRFRYCLEKELEKLKERKQMAAEPPAAAPPAAPAPPEPLPRLTESRREATMSSAAFSSLAGEPPADAPPPMYEPSSEPMVSELLVTAPPRGHDEPPSSSGSRRSSLRSMNQITTCTKRRVEARAAQSNIDLGWS